MSYRIVTDSTCNLPAELIDEMGLEIIPLNFMVDGIERQSYLKGQTVDLSVFYTQMREGKVFTTSSPNIAEAETLFRSILDKGDDVLYIGFSSALSGTYPAVSSILDRLSEEYPNNTVLHMDSLAASGGEGLLVYLVHKKLVEGASLKEAYDYSLSIRDHICHWFTVDDLMFLFRGGRVSKTSAWAGTILKIKPVLHVDDLGRLIPMEKTSGRRKSIKGLLSHMEKTAIDPENQTIIITHGDCIEDAEYLKSLIQERYGITDFIINYIDPVIGAHSGPGTLALFFVGTKK